MQYGQEYCFSQYFAVICNWSTTYPRPIDLFIGVRESSCCRPPTCPFSLIFVFVLKAFLNGKHAGYVSGVCFSELVLKYIKQAKTLKLTFAGVFFKGFPVLFSPTSLIYV